MNTVDEARAEMENVYTNPDDKRPWVVSYSGGKDSTLLLLLVCELIQKHGLNRNVYAIFSDTGIEKDGISERVQKNFEGCKSLGIKTFILRPGVKDRFFNCIIGKGYSAPRPPKLRWCVGNLKLNPIADFKKSLGNTEFYMMIGERFEESIHRKNSMQERLLPNGFYKNVVERISKNGTVTRSCQNGKYETKYCPIRNVKTKELWEYLAQFETLPWGENIEELYKQYNAENYLEIIEENKERRSGCRFCTFSSTRKGSSDCCRKEKLFCENLYELQEFDVNQRNLINIKSLYRYNNPRFFPRNKQILNNEVAVGKMTIEGRKNVLDMVRRLEKDTGKVWITPEDEEWIRTKWKEDERKIKEGSLVDARNYLITEEAPCLFDFM